MFWLNAKRRNSIANALELRLFCIKQSISTKIIIVVACSTPKYKFDTQLHSITAVFHKGGASGRLGVGDNKSDA